MANKALGLIEIRGYLGAIVAADAALKAANVSLLAIETIKAGLNTVQLIGDVSAVKSAVDTAVNLVQEKPYYITSHVIARLDQQTETLFPKSDPKKTIEQNETLMGGYVSSQPQEDKPAKEDLRGNEFKERPLALEVPEPIELEKEKSHKKYTRMELERLKVVQLRSLAYREDKVRLSKKEIKFANKLLLIDALTEIEREE
ncbi:BMC domain-containing protein [Streptococcus catagoni]|uniref:BMC domain-containing protein n=1 Tax=Streptococcus catagoni TaxID=2654874 RepID=UPI001407A98C|nr:BMC domain-containing protein [Streptococcus catagoni]